jgi:hypothetical protein
MKIKSGGGIKSRVVSHVREPKKEPIPHRASPAGAAQQGMATQFQKEPLQQGTGYQPGKMGSTGIAGARQGHAGPGPGGGNRTIYRSGSQSPTPPAHGMPEGRKI